jgi:hypothetical protein
MIRYLLQSTRELGKYVSEGSRGRFVETGNPQAARLFVSQEDAQKFSNIYSLSHFKPVKVEISIVFPQQNA